MPHLKTRRIKKYGWKADLPDHRDYALAIRRELPAAVDLRTTGFLGPVLDQGNLGSCTAHAVAGVYMFALAKESKPVYVPSRLFVYYGERVIEGTVGYDAGAEIRDGMKVVATLGAPHESLWPYLVSRYRTKPSRRTYTDGLKHEAIQYLRASGLAGIKSALADGFPVTVGFTVYESFESPQVTKTGEVPMPTPGEQVLGGHAVYAIGYDDATQRVRCRNSWGAWGDAGDFTLPYAYVGDSNLADDFWTARVVS